MLNIFIQDYIRKNFKIKQKSHALIVGHLMQLAHGLI